MNDAGNSTSHSMWPGEPPQWGSGKEAKLKEQQEPTPPLLRDELGNVWSRSKWTKELCVLLRYLCSIPAVPTAMPVLKAGRMTSPTGVFSPPEEGIQGWQAPLTLPLL